MKTSFIRLGSVLILIAILVLPYSNCGGPTDQALFPSGDPNCVDPANPQTCRDSTKVRFGWLPISVRISPGGTTSFQGQCVSGGFVKALVFVEVWSNGQFVHSMKDGYRCDNGQFTAWVSVPSNTNNNAVLRLTLKVFESETSTIETPIEPQVVATIGLAFQ